MAPAPAAARRSNLPDWTPSGKKLRWHVTGHRWQTKCHRGNVRPRRSKSDFLTPRTVSFLRPDVAPALLLQFHQPNDARRNEDGVRQYIDRVALFFLHAFLGVVACGKLNLAGKCRLLQTLDAVLDRRCIGTQHVQAWAISDDIHVYVLTLGAIVFDDVRGVIQR